VVEDLGNLVHDRAQGVMVALEIRCQHLDGGPGRQRPDRPDRRREDAGAAVGEVVTIDRGDHGMTQPHRPDRLSHPAWLIPVDVTTALAALHRAEAQARVQTSPRIMKVAVPWPQHSAMFGHRASSQTVLSSGRA